MDSLPAPFAAPEGARIGEIWFEPPPQLDGLLVKYLFTSEKLSVQVHPSDAQASAGMSGKEECWLVLDAAPGATLAIGFEQEISSEEMRAAALDGSIEHLLQWHPAKAGDFFYLPAGTVHAIGPGLSLLEIQQNCDITYRLFDYGRPRELHLDEAITVSEGRPHPPELRRSLVPGEDAQLVDGPRFRLDRIAGEPSAAILARYRGPVLVVPLDGAVSLEGVRIEAGECGWAADLHIADFSEARTSLVAQPAD
ncbi:class I mannose-6-phosphate isomerase [Allopontixanthobacter sp.]|uniref:class I mannose-6-phosphate isomerase n=1 Tax=Allopontixanthobacter sp. TaxID=2906452 RepID=UPI002AB886A1|nr:class I mannose-6-phosphate isomerase [Allopontixanthobacter sp.]MDZ4307294.1 class I mannose-6-phosphate isomerase [Allopontixanthobacter sp.]